MQTFFLYLVLLVVAVWTARLAIARGRNPWVWGGASLLMGITPWHLIGIAPLLVLLFLKNPLSTLPTRPVRPSCPKCAQPHGAGQKFCTSCGWDLNEAYSPDETVASPTKVASTQTPETLQAPATGAPATAESPAETASVPADGPQEDPLETSSPVAGPETPESTAGEPQAAEPESSAAEESADVPYKPWGMPEPGVAPTAVAMTARGINFLNEGRVQEAIDQFTKAIALDANHAEAWEKRAEAYAQQGRGEEAAEDRRRLKGLNTSSSPG